MSVLKTRDENGNWGGVPTIKGEKGEAGDQVAHAERHAKGGTDEITPSSIGAATSEEVEEIRASGNSHAENKNNPHGVTASQIGAVSKSGDTVNGNLNVNGALTVKRSDNNRKARTVVHNNTEKEADFQNYADDNNYVGIRLATEEKGAGDAAKVVHMKNGTFGSYPILHTGNKEKIFTFGTEDLTAGTSPLGTGQLHFVYE